MDCSDKWKQYKKQKRKGKEENTVSHQEICFQHNIHGNDNDLRVKFQMIR